MTTDLANLGLMDIPRGLTWSRTSVTVITMTPTGTDGAGRIPTNTGVPGDLSVESVTSALTCDITVIDEGGLHSDYAESASQGYDIYYISGVAGQKLIMVETGDLPITDWALPTGYTRYSKPIWFVRNNASSDIASFIHVGDDVCLYTEEYFPLVTGTSTSLTVVDMSDAIPSFASQMSLYFQAVNTSATPLSVGLITPSSAMYNIYQENSINSSDGGEYQSGWFTAYAVPLYAWVGGTPTGGGLTIYVRGWRI